MREEDESNIRGGWTDMDLHKKPNTVLIKAESFHPMRGHVGEGNQLIFRDGRLWTIRDGGTGWNLRDQDGTYIAGPFDAHGLTSYIVNHLEVVA